MLYPSGQINSTGPTNVKPEGSALPEPENLVRRDSLHVFLVNCVPGCLNGGFNHSHQDLVPRCRSLRVNRHEEPYRDTSGSIQRPGPHKCWWTMLLSHCVLMESQSSIP